jgi:cupin fold WbuC family metalloprotein
MKSIGKEIISRLKADAAKSDRKRAHYNLHPDLDDRIQRLCVAIDPGSYIRPHRHPEKWKWELFIIIQGSAVILTFDESGNVKDRFSLHDRGPVYAVEIPANTWHTLAAQEDGTILLEIKPGPYSPLAEDDVASWAPKEGTDRAKSFEKLFHSTKSGRKITGA